MPEDILNYLSILSIENIVFIMWKSDKKKNKAKNVGEILPKCIGEIFNISILFV